MLARAVSLAQPAYCYSSFPVLQHIKGKSLHLSNVTIQCPDFTSSKVMGIVALMCTIGQEVEKEVSDLNHNKEILNAQVWQYLIF